MYETVIVRTNNKYTILPLNNSTPALHLPTPEPKQYTTLSTLPSELYATICLYLHCTDLCNLLCCNKTICNIVQHNDIWLNILQYQQHTLQYNDLLHTDWLNDAYIHVDKTHEYNSIRQYVLHRRLMNVKLRKVWDDIIDLLDIENRVALNKGIPTHNKTCSITDQKHTHNTVHTLQYYTKRLVLPLALCMSATIHNGQNEQKLIARSGMIYGCRLLSINEIVELKHNSVSYVDNKWIPITADAGSIRYCCNQQGQIYCVHGRHVSNLSEATYVASNSYQFLQQLLTPFAR